MQHDFGNLPPVRTVQFRIEEAQISDVVVRVIICDDVGIGRHVGDWRRVRNRDHCTPGNDCWMASHHGSFWALKAA